MTGSTSGAKSPPGYWNVTFVSRYDWQDIYTYVYMGSTFSQDVNYGDIGCTGWIGSKHYEQGNLYDLATASQGTMRAKFEWVGSGPQPSTITFDLETGVEAVTWGPSGSFQVGYYYLAVDGHELQSGSETENGFSRFWAKCTGTREVTISAAGGSPVYYEVGFLNNMEAQCDAGAEVACNSFMFITIH